MDKAYDYLERWLPTLAPGRQAPIRRAYAKDRTSGTAVVGAWFLAGFVGGHRLVLGQIFLALTQAAASGFLLVWAAAVALSPAPGGTPLHAWPLMILCGARVLWNLIDLPFSLRTVDDHNLAIIDRLWHAEAEAARRAHHAQQQAYLAECHRQRGMYELTTLARAQAAHRAAQAAADRDAQLEYERQQDIERRHRAAYQKYAILAARPAVEVVKLPPWHGDDRHRSAAYQPASDEAAVRVERHVERHTIERQVVVVRCKFCAELTPVDASKCKHCGATSFV